MSTNTIDLDDPIARTSDPPTSDVGAEASKENRQTIAANILALAAKRGNQGITIFEAKELLPEFEVVSLSPVFAPLVRKGKLIRRLIGKKLKGKDCYETRINPKTNCPGNIHWHFKAAPFEHTTADVETVVRKQPKSETLAGAGERRLRERRQRDRRKAAWSKSH
jgi:hypothetical protein